VTDWLTIHHGDCREVLPTLAAESVHCVVTSPPYWGLRDYGTAGQLGLEPTPEEYVASMVAVFREVRRVLRADGTVWLNLGDCYATGAGSYRNPGSDVEPIDHGGKQAYTRDYARAQPNRMPLEGLKPKDLVGIPWRVAFALQADGWYLRSDIIWAKPNPMPESVTDRPTKAHEYVFLLSKSPRYFYDTDAVREAGVSTDGGPMVVPDGWAIGKGSHDTLTHSRRVRDVTVVSGRMPATGRNLRTIWTIATAPYPGAHFATFPPKLVEPCIKAGCPPHGVVLDPFAGTGTVGMVAQSLSRRAVLIDLNGEYLEQALARNRDIPLGLTV
jgi:DNA modification methylase